MLDSFRATFRRGLKLGFEAARENLLPGLFIQSLMVVLVIGYYRHWPTTAILAWLARGRESGGLFFAFVATGCCGGIFSELCRIYLLHGGRWRRANLEDMGFKFAVTGLGGVGASLLYAGLARVFGDAPTVGVIAVKVAIDQFVYSVIVSAPFNTATAHWKNSGYRAAAWGDLFTGEFVGSRMVPVMVTNGCFWIPTVILVYSLPLALQLPLFLLAVSIWGLLYISVTARRHPELETIEN